MIAPARKAGKLALFLVFLALQSAILGQTVQAYARRVVLIATALRNRDFDHALQLVENAIHAFPEQSATENV